MTFWFGLKQLLQKEIIKSRGKLQINPTKYVNQISTNHVFTTLNCHTLELKSKDI